MKYIKKPKGTAGRKGKYGWPQPLKDIFGITPAEYQFVFVSPLKTLIYCYVLITQHSITEYHKAPGLQKTRYNIVT
jgi:hypothetical protein